MESTYRIQHTIQNIRYIPLCIGIIFSLAAYYLQYVLYVLELLTIFGILGNFTEHWYDVVVCFSLTPCLNCLSVVSGCHRQQSPRLPLHLAAKHGNSFYIPLRRASLWFIFLCLLCLVLFSLDVTFCRIFKCYSINI